MLKTRTGGKLRKQTLVVLHKKSALFGVCQHNCGGVFESYMVLKVLGHCPIHREISDAAQNQRVGFIKRRGLERKVSFPGKVCKYVVQSIHRF